MHSLHIAFEIAADADVERVLRLVGGPCPADWRPPRAFDEIYLDTHDRRLFHRGITLLATRPDGRRASLQLDDPGRQVSASVGDGLPEFAWEIAEPELRDALAGLVGERRLQPLVRVRGIRRALVFDRSPARAIRRSWIESAEALSPAAATVVSLPRRLVLILDEAERRQAIESAVGLEGAPPRIVRALDAIAAGDAWLGSRDAALAIQPRMPMLMALRLVHRALLSRIVAARGRAAETTDGEALHALRVAARRTRAALSQITGVYPEPARGDFCDEFGWLARRTNAARDLDVFLLRVRRYRASATDRVSAALAPLQQHLERERNEQQQRVQKLLGSDRCERLLADWHDFLDRASIADVGPDAEATVRSVVSSRLAAALEKLASRFDPLNAHSPDQVLHRLRLQGKKARYLAEMFLPAYPPQAVEPLLPALVALQDDLGAHRDAALQEAQLVALSRELGGKAEDAPTILALGQLLGELQRAQATIRHSLPERVRSLEIARLAFAGRVLQG